MWRDKQGINNVMVRQANRKNIKKLLHREEALTKQEITTMLNLSLPTVNLLVQQLKEENLITEQTSEVSSGGRKPQLLCFNYDARVAVGIEVSQNHNRMVLLNMKNDLVDEQRIREPFENTDAYWNALRVRVACMLENNRIKREQVLGAGLAVPGTVKHEDKLIGLAPTLGLKRFDYSELERLFNMPIRVENEANAAGFAEVWKRDVVDSAVYISITKGVGGAFIVDNQVFIGKSGRSGEFGHMTIVPNGELCSCGKRGCFEAYCSTRRLAEHADNDVDMFFERLQAGDKKLAPIWDEYLEYLSIGISNLRMALDTDIILGGDLDQQLRGSFDKLKEKVEVRLLHEEEGPLFRISNIGKNAAAIGSALLLVSDFLEE